MKNLKEYYPQLTENEVARGINQALIDVDESLSYKDFAIGVAAVLKDEYGSHNFNPFMKILHAELGMDESLNENEDDTLAKEIDRLFGGDPYVRDGEITFRMKGEFPDSEWNEILNLVKSKGFEITRDSNYYDIEPGEREWFPRIDFKLK
jgi:hypothetical protein|tara:strand:+ start:598 stop:1047 length:450 start_codon:yes stop_codon:yes gene_type:complete